MLLGRRMHGKRFAKMTRQALLFLTKIELKLSCGVSFYHALYGRVVLMYFRSQLLLHFRLWPVRVSSDCVTYLAFPISFLTSCVRPNRCCRYCIWPAQLFFFIFPCYALGRCLYRKSFSFHIGFIL